MSSNSDEAAEQADSRTASLPTKKHLDALTTADGANDSVSDSPRKRIKLSNDQELRETRSDSDESSAEPSEDEEDGCARSVSGESDSYAVDIREGSHQNHGPETMKHYELEALHYKGPITPSGEVDAGIGFPEIFKSMLSAQHKVLENIMRPKAEMPIRQNTSYVKRYTDTFHKFGEAKNRLLKVQDQGKRNIMLEEQAYHEAKVLLAWCQFYPFNARWRGPPPSTFQKGHYDSDSKVVKEAKASFYNIVDQCLINGRLLELRAGEHGGVDDLIPKNTGAQRGIAKPLQQRNGSLNDEVVAPLETFISEDREREQANDRKALIKAIRMNKKDLKRDPKRKISKFDDLDKRRRLLTADKKYCNFYPYHKFYAQIQTFKVMGEDIDGVLPALNGSSAQLWKLMEPLPVKQLKDLQRGQGRFNGFVDSKAPTLAEVSNTNDEQSESVDMELSIASSPEPPDGANLSDADQVMVNVTGGSESGELLSEAEHFSENDPKSKLAQSFVPVKQIDGAAEDGSASAHDRVLAELTPEDLNVQMRYFHFTRSLDDVPVNEPVRCLCCGKKGHMAVDCKHIICAKCGAYNMHLTSRCDTYGDCAKCQESGHMEKDCPYKLKRLDTQERRCGLCKMKGHADEDCELFWRTSGPPWEAYLDARTLRLFCYECGKRSHLGNDCPTRQPGKPLGTSTWSLKREPPQALPAAYELAIRRRAHPSVTLPPPSAGFEDESERSNFNRPKMPLPSRKGRIEVKTDFITDQNQNSTNASFQRQFTPINKGPPPSLQLKPLQSTYRPPPLINAPGQPRASASGSRHQTYHNVPPPPGQSRSHEPDYEADLQYQYINQPPPPPRSRFPDLPNVPHEHRLPQLGNYPVQAPAPAPAPAPASKRGGDSFRPMPSAGKNAWSQFRR